MSNYGQFATSFYFEDIFPDILSFQNFVQDYKVADLTDDPTGEKIAFVQYCYKILYRQFVGNNIQYDTPEDFKLAFAQQYEDYFEVFMRELDILKLTYNITDENLLIIAKSITNQANNPNTLPNDPTEPLDFISNQTYNELKENELEGYARALKQLRPLKIREFVKRFSYLFKAIFNPNTIIYTR